MNAEQIFESIVAEALADPRVVKAKMFGSTGLKVAGKVFAMVVKGKLVVKLPKERVATLIASGHGEYFDPGHGRLMKEWVAVQPGERAEWFSLVNEAKHFVGGAH